MFPKLYEREQKNIIHDSMLSKVAQVDYTELLHLAWQQMMLSNSDNDN